MITPKFLFLFIFSANALVALAQITDEAILDQVEAASAKLDLLENGLTPGTINSIQGEIVKTHKALSQAKYEGLERQEIQVKVEEAESFLGSAWPQIDKLWTDFDQVSDDFFRAKSYTRIGEELDIVEKATFSQYEVLLTRMDKNHQKLNNLRLEYQAAEDELNALKEENELGDPICDVVQQKYELSLAHTLWFALHQTLGIDVERNEKVVVEIDENEAVVEYSMAVNTSVFALGGTLDQLTVLCDHVFNSVAELTESGMELDSVRLVMMFQDALSDLQNVQTQNYYAGDMGKDILIPVKVRDNEFGTISNSATKVVYGQSLTLVELAGLQLRGVQHYLRQSMNDNTFPVKMWMSGPNYNQGNSKVLLITLFMRYTI